ncbi:YihY/virulence factor BrkB family protein [Cypionkella sp.]|jgi:membrane protein|uniref:YihY/virulence factor BrkB family protein n=1 Tax=Cypionkella sp. TaxID=2811411 RepID=UPI002722CA03|nr:YihY/virulence factor BrkB family protein [Cypionkella sp.]MDO8984949.1 YihY/virulence factor BrkB family protein [Cypionkella sp.]MDP1576381.1 YihY/virulence factor BrkB family protein [Cypionkella sp.]MDP2049033.1 YihY/virulence factor BrkB family protein [Cypionkella sp.]
MRLRLLPPNVNAAILRYYRRTEQAELDLIAAGVAFYAFLAIFPAAAAIIAIWGFISNPSVIRDEIELLRGFLPQDAYSLIFGQVEALLAVPAGNLGLTTLISTALALWSARAGVAALIRGLNAIHHLPNRSGHWHQLRAIVLTFVLVGLVLSALVMAVILPVVVTYLPSAIPSSMLADSNLLLGIVAAVLAVGLAYRLGPNYTSTKPPLLSWGLLVAVILWVIATRGFTLYLANFASYNRVYGSIGAVVVLLMWLYVSAYAVLLGAAVDAERNRNRRPYQ